MSPVHDSPSGALLTIHLQPKAARTEFAGLQGDALRFRVQAPPTEGAANAALCDLLATIFDLPKRAVLIRSGAASRHKCVLLQGISATKVRQVLGLRET